MRPGPLAETVDFYKFLASPASPHTWFGPRSRTRRFAAFPYSVACFPIAIIEVTFFWHIFSTDTTCFRFSSFYFATWVVTFPVAVASHPIPIIEMAFFAKGFAT